uniref:Uncharacterized protein n=1 Tax=Desertifilum tharense IPPAS B-1220 TaxID=1781255 RepID=A0ACD5GYH2_9CYAN
MKSPQPLLYSALSTFHSALKTPPTLFYTQHSALSTQHFPL